MAVGAQRRKSSQSRGKPPSRSRGRDPSPPPAAACQCGPRCARAPTNTRRRDSEPQQALKSARQSNVAPRPMLKEILLATAEAAALEASARGEPRKPDADHRPPQRNRERANAGQRAPGTATQEAREGRTLTTHNPPPVAGAQDWLAPTSPVVGLCRCRTLRRPPPCFRTCPLSPACAAQRKPCCSRKCSSGDPRRVSMTKDGRPGRCSEVLRRMFKPRLCSCSARLACLYGMAAAWGRTERCATEAMSAPCVCLQRHHSNPYQPTTTRPHPSPCRETIRHSNNSSALCVVHLVAFFNNLRAWARLAGALNQSRLDAQAKPAPWRWQDEPGSPDTTDAEKKRQWTQNTSANPGGYGRNIVRARPGQPAGKNKRERERVPWPR